jgi:membrane-associated phospholipid phosphatase
VFTGSDANVSFYSGHASNAFAIAVSLYRAHVIRGDGDAKKLGVIGLISASATAYLRIAADKHYLSDVVVGAGAGSAIGWLIPALHTIGATHKATIVPVVSPTSRAVFVKVSRQ